MRPVLALLLAATAVVAGCTAIDTSNPRAAGEDTTDAALGRELIVAYGCGACHTVPGIQGADGLVGPPLTAWSERTFIAGNLANTPDNLVAWITNPQAVEPGTAMPNLGVTAAQARNIVAYLYTLER